MSNTSCSRILVAAWMGVGLVFAVQVHAQANASPRDPLTVLRTRMESARSGASQERPTLGVPDEVRQAGRDAVVRYLVSSASRATGSLRSSSLAGSGEPLAASTSGAGSTQISTREFDEGGDGVVEHKLVTAVTFDAQGKLVRRATAYYSGTDADWREVNTNTFDSRGNPLVSVSDHDAGGDGTIEGRETVQREYDASGHLLKTVDKVEDPSAGTIGNVQTTTIQYSQKGVAVSAVIEDDNGGDGTIDIRQTNTGQFDAAGRLVDVLYTVDQDADGTIEQTTHDTYTYDAQGHTLEHRLEVEFGSSSYTSTTVFTYDAQGRVVKTVLEDDNLSDGTVELRRTTENTYDPQGDLVRTETVQVEPLLTMDTVIESTFGPNSQLLHEKGTTTSSAGAASGYEIAFTNDARGRRLGTTTEYDFDGDGVVDETDLVQYAYDARGNQTLFVVQFDNALPGPVNYQVTTTSTYDPRGNLLTEVTDRDSDGDGAIEEREKLTVQYQRGMDEPVVLEGTTPAGPTLRAAAPNPFQDGSSLGFSLGTESEVELTIFDASGRVVRDLVSGRVPAGDHQVSWDGRDSQARAVPNGAYFARLRAAGHVTTRVLFRLR